jgi:hypothetical protein
MTAQIHFTPDFPHATLQGYEQGCTGQICEGREQFGWSCADTQRKYVGDYQWRKWLLAGMTPVQIMAELEAEKVAARERVSAERARVKAVKRKVDRRLGPRTTPKPYTSGKPITHGTLAGYKRGCTTDHDCPAEVSCRQAKSNYNIANRLKAKQNMAARNHGSRTTYALGCTAPEMYPNFGTAETCAEVGRAAAMENYKRGKAA